MSELLAITALGVPIDVVCVGDAAPEARTALTSRWSLCARDEETPAVTRVEVHLGDPHDLRPAMVELTQAVTRAAIAGRAGELLMFHAAGLADRRTGAAAVLVAPGGTGKTTACLTLGHGRGYLSDETVGVRADGSVVAYPKPLSVRRRDAGIKDEVDPGDLGLSAAPVSPRAEAVLLLDRDPDGPTEPQLVPLDPFDALTEVAPETSSLERLERPLHRLHDLFGSVRLTARVRYREAAALEPLLRELIGPREQSA